VFPDLHLTEVETRLSPGDSLVLYTDGVTEARGPQGFYGSARLQALVASLAGASADAIADAILAEVTAFQHGQLRDDVALLVVQAQRRADLDAPCGSPAGCGDPVSGGTRTFRVNRPDRHDSPPRDLLSGDR
jgi:hypothetical protein